MKGKYNLIRVQIVSMKMKACDNKNRYLDTLLREIYKDKKANFCNAFPVSLPPPPPHDLACSEMGKKDS